MTRSNVGSLKQCLDGALGLETRFLWAAGRSVSLDALRERSCLHGRAAEFRGHSVLLATHDQLATALALIELDGLANRIVLCPPDVPLDHLGAVISDAAVNAIVTDRGAVAQIAAGVQLVAPIDSTLTRSVERFEPHETQWILLTSGTAGAPKMLVHSLGSLSGAINTTNNLGTIWGTFYDIRRYGGLQIFFRSVLGGGSFVLSSVDESSNDYLVRLARHDATHILGTPSHWRRALMSPAAGAISPRYIRLSGEVADQAILDRLRSFYPGAKVTHAFASTESGVGFEVNDGLEGFPASIVGVRGDVEIKVEDGSLRFRSPRTALCYLGPTALELADDEGFVDTGDMVERRGERYYFLGRKTGVVNVGGLKVHPEEVEAVINRHPWVRMSLVTAKRNPITGSIVVADVVLETRSDRSDVAPAQFAREILEFCRARLQQHKVPAMIRIVPMLSVAAAGKLSRHGA